MYKKHTLCQSCGMPLEKDPRKGGTESNGSKSKTYCSYCYVNGKFTFEGNLEEYKTFMKGLLQKQGLSQLKIRFFLYTLSRLDRWKASKHIER